MTSDKQREANRRNAQHSTGPRTAAGKSASSQNSFRHGICAADVTLYKDHETQQAVEQRINEYFDFYQPASPLERDALAEIARIRIAMDRLDRIENGIVNDARLRVYAESYVDGPDGKRVYSYDRANYPEEEHRTAANMHLGKAWLQNRDVMEALSRQQARLSTRLRRAEKRFDELRSNRPNEPISEEPPVVATPTPPEPPPDRKPAHAESSSVPPPPPRTADPEPQRRSDSVQPPPFGPASSRPEPGEESA